MIYIGEIKETKEYLVKVLYGNTTTDFLPFLLPFNAFKKHLSPPKVGQKVVLVKIDDDVGFVLGSLLDKGVEFLEDCEKITFEDKVSVEYKGGIVKIEGSDEIIIKSKKLQVLEAEEVKLQSKKVEILESDEVVIKEAKEVKIECENVNLKAQSVKIQSEEIKLGGDDALGVVTGACLCPFTGSPHADVSQKVKASK